MTSDKRQEALGFAQMRKTQCFSVKHAFLLLNLLRHKELRP